MNQNFETCPCTNCSQPTRMTGTQLCDACWELDRRHPGTVKRAEAEQESAGKYRKEFLDLALDCGAQLTGKPDGSEAITVLFTIDAWRKFDLMTAQDVEPVAAAISYWEGPTNGNGVPYDEPTNTSPLGWSEYQPVTLKHGKAIDERGDKDKRVKWLYDRHVCKGVA